MRRIAVALATVSFIFGWLMPNHNFPWLAFENEAPIFVALAFLAGAYWTEKGLVFLFPKGALLLVFLAMVPILQFAFGQVSYWGDAYIATIYLGSGAVAYGLGYRLTKEKSAISAMQFVAWIFIFVATISVWIALRQCLDLANSGFESEFDPWSRGGANLAQPNQLSSLLLIAFVSTLYLYRYNKISSAVLWILSAYIGLGIAVAQSRFVLVVFVMLFVFLAWRAVDTKKTIWKTRVFSLLLLVFVEWLSWPYILNMLSGGDLVIRQTGDSARLLIMTELLDAFLQRPFLGYGWNQISVAQSLVAISHPHTVYVSSAHNIVVDVLLWNGLLIGMAILIPIGNWLWTRLRRSLEGDAWYGLAVILVLLVHSLFEYPLHYAYFFISLCFFAGSVETNVPWIKTVRLPSLLRLPVFVIGILTLFSVLVEYPVAQTNLSNARLLGSKFSQEDGLIDSLSLKDGKRLYFLTQFNDLEQLLSMPLYGDEVRLASSDVNIVASRYPIPDVLLRAALLELTSGDCRSAARHVCLIERLYGEKKYKAAMNIVLGRSERGQYCVPDSLINYCDIE